MFNDDAFQLFAVRRKKDLQRIAGHTRGEYRLEDVVNEAWAMAASWHMTEDESMDLLNTDCQSKLLRYLYQHLVRYTDKNVRNAVRLDQAPADSEYEGDVHPLMHMLAANEACDPLNELLDKEAMLTLESSLDAHGSLASAYVYLLRRFDNKMSFVADHLRISPSYAYRCCARARRQAERMTHIRIPLSESFVPGPWRRFRIRRPQTQLAFNFDDELGFFSP